MASSAKKRRTNESGQCTERRAQRKTGRTVTDTRSRPTMNCGKSNTTRLEVAKVSGAIDDVAGRIASKAPGGRSCATRPLNETPESPVPKLTTTDLGGYTGFS